jgi:hypothetical protein
LRHVRRACDVCLPREGGLVGTAPRITASVIML